MTDTRKTPTLFAGVFCALLLGSACGRIGYDELVDGDGDGDGDGGPQPGAACVAPTGPDCPLVESNLNIGGSFSASAAAGELRDQVELSCGRLNAADHPVQFTPSVDLTLSLRRVPSAGPSTLAILDGCGGSELLCHAAEAAGDVVTLSVAANQAVVVVVESAMACEQTLEIRVEGI